MLSWWTSILLLFNGTSLLANYLSAIAGWTLVLVLVLIIWKRRHFHFGSFTLDKATSSALSPARISGGLKTGYPEFVGRVSKQDPKWWKKYGADTSSALVLVDDKAMQDKIKEYLFPHLMEGTGLVLQSISEWWDLMKERCDINKNGILELKDMEQCRFDLINRPKKFDVLMGRLNDFLADKDNVENLWKFILEHQHQINDQQQHYNSEL